MNQIFQSRRHTSFPRFRGIVGLRLLGLTVLGLGLLSTNTNRAQASEGDLDSTFGTGGKVITSFGSVNSYLYAVVTQPDGKVVTAGTSAAFNGSTFTQDIVLVRYNSDGSLDATFGTGGFVSTQLPKRNSRIDSLILQPDGKILAGGVTPDPGTTAPFVSVLLRYNTDGSLDTTFGTGGSSVQIPNNINSDLVLQADNKIVAVGSLIVRYNTDGSLDTTFGNNGKVDYQDESNSANGITLTRIAVQADGKLVAGGQSYSAFTDSDFTVMRLNTNGSLDTTFGTGGSVSTDFGQKTDSLSAIVVQPDGKIVAGGTSGDYSNYSEFFLSGSLVRYNASGSIDTNFGNSGKIYSTPTGDRESYNDLVLQRDGKLLVGGITNYTDTAPDRAGSGDFLVRRFSTDGNLDTAFGVGGQAVTDFRGTRDGISGLALKPDGTIVAAGTSFSPMTSRTDNALAQYRVNRPPVAASQSLTVKQNQSATAVLNASDADSDPLSFRMVTAPIHGTVSLTDNQATYTPAKDYVGTDSFSFVANDGLVDSSVVTVSITVNSVNTPNALVYGRGALSTGGDYTVFSFFITTSQSGAPSATSKLLTINGRRVIRSTRIDSLVTDGTTATITGRATINGKGSYTFTARMNDLSRSRNRDSYSLQVSDGTNMTNTIAVGTIVVSIKPPT